MNAGEPVIFGQAACAAPQSSPRPSPIPPDLRRIKENEDLKSIPTVVLTTSAAESEMEAFGFYWLAWNRFPD